MNEDTTREYLHLRLIVGYLGERAQLGWWPTAFFERSSRLFLVPVFARTARLTQYHGVTEAARRLHDNHIGIGSVYHLFRLPEEIEQDLHNLMLVVQHDDQMFAGLQSQEAALRELNEIAEGAEITSDGPVAIGHIDGIRTARAPNALAQSYLSAFSRGARIYPYFAA